jgi:multicomponent Na+:H+ antiporter subunit E
MHGRPYCASAGPGTRPFLARIAAGVYYCAFAYTPARAVPGGLFGLLLVDDSSPRPTDPGWPVNKRFLDFLLMGLMLAAIWLLLSGLFKPLLLVLAALSVLLTLLLAGRMNIVDRAAHPVWAAVRYIPYWPWLAVEIVKSSIDVARRVLSPTISVSPTVFEVRASQKTVVGRVVLANSITLTPGTVTLDVDGDRLRVHALSRESVDYLLEGEMDRRVTRAEGVVAPPAGARPREIS